MATSTPGKELPVFTVDAFSSVPFSGNPAAVCLLEDDQEITDDVKQKLAAEMNLPVTAFVSKLNPEDTFKNGQRFRLRWFTTTKEVIICGHATLATTSVLLQCYGNTNDRLTYETPSGLMYSTRKDSKIVLDFPNLDPKPALGDFKDLVEVASCGLPVVDVQICPLRMLLVRLKDDVSRSDFETLSPDAERMVRAGTVLGVILTVKGSGHYDFYSRYFGPWDGIDEDPVCGSGHCVLTPYWAKILGKNQMTGRQCSKRGGDIYVNLRQDGRVDIAGHVKVVLKGTVTVS